MNKEHYVFLDRDGTINVDTHYLHEIEKFKYIDGAVEALKLLSDNGYHIIIVTNQSGIGRGMFKEEDYLRLNDWMLQDLKCKGVNITDTFYCPHHKGSPITKYDLDCECRKPKLGMFIEAQKKYNIDFSNCFAIGDRLRDLSLCNETGCKGYLIGNTEDEKNILDVKNNKYKNVKYAKSLLESVKDLLIEEV